MKRASAIAAVALLLQSAARAEEPPSPGGGPASEPSKNEILNAAEADQASPQSARSTWNAWENRFFTLRLSGGYLFDAANYHQDQPSQQQIALMRSSGLRDLRLIAAGRIKLIPRVSYTVGYMYDGTDHVWRFRQTGLMLDLPELAGHFFLGRTKEGFSTNKIMVGYNGWTIERSAANDAFVPILADGLKWIGAGFGGHLVYNLGGFADFLTPKEPYEKNDWIGAGRAVWLPFSEANPNLLHLAIEARYGASLGGTLQYKSKPESFTAPLAVDTGKFPAAGAVAVGAEAYYQHGPLLMGFEYYVNRVFSAQTNNPLFHGGEALVAWLVTGETRPYDLEDAIFEAVVPSRPVFSGGPGAWELVARVSYVDLDAGKVAGGRFWRITPMVSWYMSANVRLELESGYSRLDRMGLSGGTGYLQARIQLTFQ